mgnify:CR=1 FL=1
MLLFSISVNENHESTPEGVYASVEENVDWFRYPSL